MANMKNPTKAIRAFCIDCMGGHANYVADCPSGGCPLHAFRMGNNPYNKKDLTPEQRAAIAERARKSFGLVAQ
jgi:hypothetical protein